LKLLLLLFCSVVALGQSASPAPQTKPQTDTSSSGQKSENQGPLVTRHDQDAIVSATVARSNAARGGDLEILSNTQGVDFGPYLQELSKVVRHNWYILVPEFAGQKQGKLAIEFSIGKDGHVSDMHLAASSGDVALDRPAWGSITNSDPFKPLPADFKGQYLALRLHFTYNPEKNFLVRPGKGDAAAIKKSTSGIVVSISAPGDPQVQAGGSQVVTAKVTGTEEKAVEWKVTGSSCAGSACGKMIGDLYIAPNAVPSLPYVTLTAIAKADPTAKASVTFHIVQPAPQSH
jgi:TonB family protein